jgi:3-keto-disaccharide hydrolase
MTRATALAIVAGLAACADVRVSAQVPAPAPAPPPVQPPAVERVALPSIPLRETPALLESDPAGWTSVQPGLDLAGWTRLPWPASATLGPQQWSVDATTGYLVCDGKGQHEWLRYDREMADAAFHVEWRFTPVEGADKYNSGVFARTLTDLSAWHQAQVGLKGGFLFGVTPVQGIAKRVTQEPAALRIRPAGEWNTYEVVARGRTLSLWVNGAVTGEIAIDVPRGHLGLEAEGWRIEFRNLKVKTLD